MVPLQCLQFSTKHTKLNETKMSEPTFWAHGWLSECPNKGGGGHLQCSSITGKIYKWTLNQADTMTKKHVYVKGKTKKGGNMHTRKSHESMASHAQFGRGRALRWPEEQNLFTWLINLSGIQRTVGSQLSEQANARTSDMFRQLNIIENCIIG